MKVGSGAASLVVPPDLPRISDLAATLHFAPEQGHIWLAGRRMVLVHARTMGIVRREVINAVGYDRARAVFTRQGYEAGAMDADVAAKVRSNDSVYDAFSVGPQLHALEGAVLVEPITVDVDVANGRFYAEYRWRHSSECAEHVTAFGIGQAPAGWGQIGYASGYASVYFGRPIVYREVECIAMGHDECRIVGKPAEAWDDAEPDLRYMRSEQLHTATDAIRTVREGDAKAADNRWRVVGASSGFNTAFDMLRDVADTDAPVLFQGESGVGKEMFARNLHAMGKRAEKPFVAVNCAAISETLIESELFGVERGAFTGATVSRPGRFERAEGGTLFLDEIATLSLIAQAKLLRALQEGEIERVGDTRVRSVDIRLVAATNVDLREAVAKGAFRADLFYRINVFPLRIPPLRDRRADIPLLMDHFLSVFRTRYDKKVSGFDEQAVSAMLSYDWPGNVRELENMVARGVILGRRGEPLRVHHLFTSGERLGDQRYRLGADGRVRSSGHHGNRSPVAIAALMDAGLTMDDVERDLLDEAFRRCSGNRSAAARLLGVSRAQFNHRYTQASKAR
ncbi:MULTISPECIES: sigma-54-dependent Fis family transcriptional regulator [Sphingosinicellaceae]|uniref:sigma-54-dependent Fis family transcriptional regulator n=1 Tax=Sphingosinicellaceae TaxID=2820280 RepID=UPI001C1E6221|nr:MULTISPECIES: sigma-54-dependent Fis family transcriptional regulator [Polymorphobacter]